MSLIKNLTTLLTSIALTIALVMPVSAQTQVVEGEQFRAPVARDYGAQFQQIIERLREKHVNPDAVKSDDELFKIAIDAMLKAIGDRHGNYFAPEGFKRFQQDMRPDNYSGVGIKIARGAGGLVILEIFDGSGLPLMGIHVGDVITRAYSNGGTDVTWGGKNVKELVGAIKGPAGTDVTLSFKRGSTDLGEVTVQRVQTRQQYVYMKRKENGVLTIRVTQFSSTIADDIKEMLEDHDWLLPGGKLNTKLITGVAFDFRSNPGGSLKSAWQFGDMMMPKGVNVVRVIQPPSEDSGGRPRAIDFITAEDRLFPNTIPRVMLVNRFSASASEIVSGAAKRHKEMPIFGTTTYGKGSVQTVFPLDGGGAFKTTTAIYLAGGDVEIDGVGVTPDSNVQQPDAPGLSQDHKRLNGNIIRKSMNPMLDYQLGVAHKYLEAFISEGHSMESQDSVREAINKAHGAPKAVMIKSFCNEWGLRGCPASVSNPTVMGTTIPRAP